MKISLPLILWIIVFEAISFAIGMATQGDVSGWYAGLIRPPLVPPNFVFPVMWSVLYVLIASCGWMLWQNRVLPNGTRRLALFGFYMALNWSWTFLFFTAHMMLPALIWILVMNAIAIALILHCRDTLRLASLLMIPPTLWTCFAAYLNAGLWWLNQ